MRNFLFLVLVASLSLGSCDSLRKAGGAGTAVAPLTEGEAAEGVRQALDQGIGRGIDLLHARDGFFSNAAYKIGMPPEAQRIEKTLRDLGMGGMIDRAVLQINRGAEEAMAQARPIFADALRQMTITDALAIVRGGGNAATQYFRSKTTAALTTAFTPIISSTLNQLSATKYYDEVVGLYNGFPATQQKLNPDLVSYVTAKAVDALFDQVAQEEANIRANAAARTTEVLKRVFGPLSPKGGT